MDCVDTRGWIFNSLLVLPTMFQDSSETFQEFQLVAIIATEFS